MTLVFTLLLVNNQKCSKCFSQATYILLGRENEFLGFFCNEHGDEAHKALESKYTFESENRWSKTRARAIKRKYIKK
jgi:hypothetical protein